MQECYLRCRKNNVAATTTTTTMTITRPTVWLTGFPLLARANSTVYRRPFVMPTKMMKPSANTTMTTSKGVRLRLRHRSSPRHAAVSALADSHKIVLARPPMRVVLWELQLSPSTQDDAPRQTEPVR
jgi:hypothetical protein